MCAYPPVLKRLLLLFLVSLFVTVSWGQGENLTPQPKPSETNLTKIEPQISTGGSGAKAVQPPKNYALLVGISCYDSLPPLRYAHKDALDVANFLREEFKGAIEVNILIDANAKADSIRQWLNDKRELEEELRDSKIYIILSGHGGTHDSKTRNGFFYPVEYEKKTGKSIGKSVITMKYIWDTIYSYVASGAMVVLMIDACHAEGFHPEKLKDVVLFLPKENKSVAFLASLEEQQAIEPTKIENGLLVYHFIRGTTNELLKDGKAQVFELRDYLSTEVPKTALEHNHRQIPVVVGDSALVIFESHKEKLLKPFTLPSRPKGINYHKRTPLIIPKTPPISQDSMLESKVILEQKIKEKDWQGAYLLLDKFRLKGTKKNFQLLRNSYVMACYKEAEVLSLNLVNFYEKYEFETGAIRLSSFVNAKRVNLKSGIATLLVALKYCIDLLPSSHPSYSEIVYRKLVFEGYLTQNVENLIKAIEINPDYTYVYLIILKIYLDNNQQDDFFATLKKVPIENYSLPLIAEQITNARNKTQNHTTISTNLFSIKNRLMIIPADDLLKRLNCLTEKTIQGQRVVQRDYLKAYTDLIDLRFVSGAIAQKFVDAGFPQIEDLEQSLKNIEGDATQSELRDVQIDAITQVLNRVKPDVILELSYKFQEGAVSNRLTFSFVAKDAYTSKLLAAVSNPGMQTVETDVPTMLAEQVEMNLNNFTSKFAKHAEDVEVNGRTIRLLVSVDNNADFDLEDNCGSTGQNYIDVIMDIVEKHKKKDSETPNPGSGTTGKRMEISNIRIDTIDPVTKRGLSARDWSRYVITDIQKTCGVKAKNVSQGIGDGRIILSK